MKIVHWTMQNGSGMHRVAESYVVGEQKIGLDSVLCDPDWRKREEWIYDGDINVCHSDFPEQVRRKGKALVYTVHGTPEHVFKTALENSRKGYGFDDTWCLMHHWFRLSDAIVTTNPRHKWIVKSLCDKRTAVTHVPMGVDTDFWKPVPSQGKFLGAPSVLTAENCHDIKWPLDLLMAWPLVWEQPEFIEARLHMFYLPYNQHRFWYPLMYKNGSGFSSYSHAGAVTHESLRHGLCSVDYYCGLVRYGDLNRMSLEANACGAKTISFEGNAHSDFWVKEGDQRRIAKQLISIFKGETEPRRKTPVPSLIDQAVIMKEEVYDKL